MQIEAENWSLELEVCRADFSPAATAVVMFVTKWLEISKLMAFDVLRWLSAMIHLQNFDASHL